MSEVWRIFFETYCSNSADIFVYIIAPLLWGGCIFIVRGHMNCWQISKAIGFIVMYMPLFFVLLPLIAGAESFTDWFVLMVIFAPQLPWLIVFILNIIELVYWGRKRVRFEKSRELKFDLMMRSTLQLLLLLAIAWGYFFTTAVHMAAGVYC